MQLSEIKTYVYRMKVQRRFSYIHIHKFQGLEFHHYCTFCLHSLQQIATDAINIHLALAPLYAQLIKYIEYKNLPQRPSLQNLGHLLQRSPSVYGLPKSDCLQRHNTNFNMTVYISQRK